jgi:dephospho-CoA kinase
MLVAVSGLSGAGKTTTIDYLEREGAGRRIYLGDLVHDEVNRRKLAQTLENERLIRLELRQQGMDALARLALPTIVRLMREGCVLLDAICTPEERMLYEAELRVPVAVIAISASFEIRAARLEKRQSRPTTREDLERRDRTELEQLRLEEVLASAEHKLTNEATLGELEAALDEFRRDWMA